VIIVQGLREWVVENVGVSGTSVIWAEQDGPIPARPFVDLKILSTSRVGIPEITAPNGVTGIGSIKQEVLQTLQTRIFGPAAATIAMNLRNSIEKPSVQAKLRADGLAYVRVLADIQQVPEIAGTKWESRVIIDWQFRSSVVLTDDLGVIENVEITGEIDDLTYTETIPPVI
jgi:hypothetical protein